MIGIDDRRGFALPAAIFVIAFLTISLAAITAMISSERRVLDSVAELLGLDVASKKALAPHIDGINAALMHMRHSRDFDKEHASDEDRERQHTAMVEMRESMEAHHAAVAELLTAEQLEELMTYVHARVDMTDMTGHDDDGHEEHRKKPGGRL